MRMVQVVHAPSSSSSSSPHFPIQTSKPPHSRWGLVPSVNVNSSSPLFPIHSQRDHISLFTPHRTSSSVRAAFVEVGSPSVSTGTPEDDVLKALSQIIDPDFGTDIVTCGFVKDLQIDKALGEVSFRLELTTPACPIKDVFEQKANEVVAMLPWVKNVNVTMSAQPARPIFSELLPAGLQTISNIVAVSSCKGGVGKSTVAVNLAYTLANKGARVGIFDADVYGPSLPTMVSPENRLLERNPEKKTIIPTEYMGVCVARFNEFDATGGPIAKELIPKLTVVRKNLSSKLGVVIPEINVRQVIATIIILKGVGRNSLCLAAHLDPFFCFRIWRLLPHFCMISTTIDLIGLNIVHC